MTAFSLVYTLHVLAALVWVGGMFFTWMIVRPAVIAALQGPARLQLWLQILPRFFTWVWVVVVLLPITGVGMIQLQFPSFDTAPRYVQVMIGLYVVMAALFMRVHSLQLPELRQAVQAEQWPEGVAVLGRMRRMMAVNLLLGLAVVAIAAARPGF
jgi:uncharacterized membrane protein